VQNFSPLEALDAGVRSDLVFCNGDIVKIELGVHVGNEFALKAYNQMDMWQRMQ
jgi:methionine aminopeptidase